MYTSPGRCAFENFLYLFDKAKSSDLTSVVN